MFLASLGEKDNPDRLRGTGSGLDTSRKIAEGSVCRYYSVQVAFVRVAAASAGARRGGRWPMLARVSNDGGRTEQQYYYCGFGNMSMRWSPGFPCALEFLHELGKHEKKLKDQSKYVVSSR